MKRICLLAITFACTILASCGRGPIDALCEEYAPDGTEISWTEYNTPDAVTKYFRCHKKTIEEHEGDTVRVCGWIAFTNTNCGEPPIEINNTELIYLSPCAEFYSDHNPADRGYGFMYERAGGYIEIAPESWNKKLYVRGTVMKNYLDGRGCCGYTYKLKVTYIDTIP